MLLKAKVFEFLEVIIEETQEDGGTLARNVAYCLEKKHVLSSMGQLWDLSQQREAHCTVLTAMEKGLFHAYHTLKRLEEHMECQLKDLGKFYFTHCHLTD